ncbi:conserved exported hypothetical protein [Hyella patelloides LEGE 07179]|uniref:Secreted protein n=1 Tax=Hyella patelloides LEGE 07179 TaxID=945734 RepID=A0A563VV63_9CYAN|nr:COP23 domain-containing protein [Hyella patelloides]VEP15348.1 conserved exported hypothetical protein [Hyella patelloides LEGE 07179]
MCVKQSLAAILTITGVATTVMMSQSSQAQSDKFICQVNKQNIPTTYANTPEGPKPVMRFASTHFPPPYTPMRRCQEITARYNKFYAQGILEYMTSGWVNRLPVICAGQTCNKETVLLTLKPDQEPDQALQEILANRSGASGPTVQSSGSGSITIRMEDYLNKTQVEEPGNSVNSVPSPVRPDPPVQTTNSNDGVIY